MMEDENITLNIPDRKEEYKSIIKVIGVGGGGSNAVNYMLECGIHGVEFVVCNTDIQALRDSKVKYKIQLGKKETEGRGAGCIPERGRLSAVESISDIDAVLEHDTKMIFVTAGMGGGTGTGAAPIIAARAKELGILTVGIVTLPFKFEGSPKVVQAMKGIDELQKNVDALLIVVNDRLLEMYGDLPLSDAFKKADDVLATAAKSIAEIITMNAYVAIDLADVISVMRDSGIAIMGAADAEGNNRALDAVEFALDSPLLNNSSVKGASDILVNMLYGTKELSVEEQNEILDYLIRVVGRNVNFITGIGRDERLGDSLRVAIIATGFNKSNQNEDYQGNREEGEPYFAVTEAAPDLELDVVDLENQHPLQTKKRETRKTSIRAKSTTTRIPKTRKKEPNVNDMPDTETWLRDKRMGGNNFFDDED